MSDQHSDLELLAEDGPICVAERRRRTPRVLKSSDVGRVVRLVEQLNRRADMYVIRNPSGAVVMTGSGEARRPCERGSDDWECPPRESEIELLRWILIDVDPREGVEPERAHRHVLDALDRTTVPLWSVVDSGRGTQAHVRLAEPLIGCPDGIAAMKAIAGVIYRAVDAELDPNLVKLDATQNVNRLSRLIGSVNHRTGRRAQVVWAPREEMRWNGI